MSVAASTIALVGALGIGSVLGQYVGGAKDRRTARSEVLGALNDVEQARWVPQTDAHWSDAVRRFQAAALVARLPRDEVMEYLVLAQAARWASRDANESDPFSEGAIDSVLSDAAREGAHAISQAAWTAAPVRWTLRKGRRERVRQAVAKINDPKSLLQVDTSRQYGVA